MGIPFRKPRGGADTGASAATTLTLLEPVVATVLAVLIVGERLDPVAWAGLGAILAGILLLVSGRGPLLPAFSAGAFLVLPAYAEAPELADYELVCAPPAATHQVTSTVARV